MGLTLMVGPADAAFTEPYATHVRRALEHHFGTDLGLSSEHEPWYSEELAWSSWRELQERAISVVSEEELTHLLSMEAWKGVYLPVRTEPGALEGIPGDSTPIAVGSLPTLCQELTLLGAAIGVPTSEAELQQLAKRYREDDDLVDEDMDVQTFVQLVLATKVATARCAPLWVVK